MELRLELPAAWVVASGSSEVVAGARLAAAAMVVTLRNSTCEAEVELSD